MESSKLHYGHPRMPRSERAKIFVPFDPLKGYREALAEREYLADRDASTVPDTTDATVATSAEPDDQQTLFPDFIGRR